MAQISGDWLPAVRAPQQQGVWQHAAKEREEKGKDKKQACVFPCLRTRRSFRRP